MRKSIRYLTGVLVVLTLYFTGCTPAKSRSLSGDVSDPFESSKSADHTIDGLGTFPNMTPTDAQAIQAVASESQPLAPQIDMDFSDQVEDGLQLVVQMEQRGQDTSAIRIQLAGQMMIECGADASQYRPFPGEPLLGTWENKCANPSSGSRMTTKGNYSGGTNGSTGPLKSITVVGAGWGPGYTSTGAGSCSVDSSGKGSCATVWTASVGVTNSYVAQVTDQPNSGTGTFQVVSGTSPDCSTGSTSLVASTNPIPARYTEAMKKMAACYKRVITLTSPILWEQISQLSPAQQQQLLLVMAMQNK